MVVWETLSASAKSLHHNKNTIQLVGGPLNKSTKVTVQYICAIKSGGGEDNIQCKCKKVTVQYKKHNKIKRNKIGRRNP